MDKVGIYDNFFDLGGHSLLMVQVYNRLREAAQHELSMVDLFKYPTINALAKHIGQAQREGAPAQPPEMAGKLQAGRERLRQQQLRRAVKDPGGSHG